MSPEVSGVSIIPYVSITVLNIDKLAAAEFTKKMLHMPGIVHSYRPLAIDAFQMAKTDDNFHCTCLHWAGSGGCRR
jgi:hypothetical protein